MTFLNVIENSEADLLKHESMRPQGIYPKNISSPDGARKSAVAIHLFLNDHKDYETFLIKRSVYEGKHSGQMAFPGGKMDELDENLEFTARRESHEELGIPMESGLFIKQITPVYIPVSNFMMFPQVFFHENRPEVFINTREVQSYYTLNLKDLVEHIPIETRQMPFQADSLFHKEVPGFVFEGEWIWGATALVINELKILYEKTRSL